MPPRPRTLSLPLDFSAVPTVSARAPAPPVQVETIVLSVAELDRRLKRLIESAGSVIHVEGEIAGLREAGSGHCYFSLKDEREDATLDCVMYRAAPARSRRLLSDGARVVLIGRPTFWAPRGRLQFTAEEARPVGRGALLEALERLKEKLSAEGLFEPARKRKLPLEARVIGVVTSAGGAAIHDIVKVAFRRGAVRLLLSPAAVQGAGSAQQMVEALAKLARVPEVEVIILGRGGGSADDLSAFNDERLVRQVAASRVPVVSAVGHEIDTTLTDLVADARASTPSQAAELLVADSEALAATIEHLRARLDQSIERALEDTQDDLDRLRARLGTPGRLLAPHRQQIDEARERLLSAATHATKTRQTMLSRLDRRLSAHHPLSQIASAHAAIRPLELRLVSAVRRAVSERRQQLARNAGSLDALSPLAVLGRGYAIATGPSGKAIHDAREVALGDTLTVRVHHGRIEASVIALRDRGPLDDGGVAAGRTDG